MAARPIITLLTDFGEGTYVPSVKGVLLGLAPDARIIDITHTVSLGDIGTAGRLLRHTAPYFPEGSIHLAVVDPGVGGNRRPVVLRADHSYFVGPDNGLFGAIVETCDSVEAFVIHEGSWTPRRVAPTFHGRDIFAHVAGGLARGDPPDRFGNPVPPETLVPLPGPRPRYEKNRCSGRVVWVDRYGNLITDLEREEVERWRGDSPFRACLGGTWIDTRVHTFSDAEAGSLVVLFGSWETLEVVVAAGSASDRLDVGIGEPIVLERIHAR